MAVSVITYTPISNIADGVLKDAGIYSRIECDAYNDMFTMKNPKRPDRMDTLINVSLFDDTVVINGQDCKILHMLTK